MLQPLEKENVGSKGVIKVTLVKIDKDNQSIFNLSIFSIPQEKSRQQEKVEMKEDFFNCSKCEYNFFNFIKTSVFYEITE